MARFKSIGGDVFCNGQYLAPRQIFALSGELRDFADAAFKASDFTAYERHVASHDSLIAACTAANRWARAGLPSNTNRKAA